MTGPRRAIPDEALTAAQVRAGRRVDVSAESRESSADADSEIVRDDTSTTCPDAGGTHRDAQTDNDANQTFPLRDV